MKTRNAALLALSITALASASVAVAQEISVTPDRLKWQQSVASPSETALLLGGPGQPGPSVVRARLKPGMRVMPHSHPVDVHVTVLSGTLLYGQGESFDEAKMKEYPAGSFFVETANLPHYQMPKGNEGVVFQASATGANAFNYANAKDDPRNARAELAPTGKLRVGLLVANPVFVSKDGPATEMQGVAVELARELAKRLGVAFEPVRYPSVANMIEAAKSRDWDVAFLGFEPGRTAEMDFTGAYLDIANSLLVPAGSKIRSLGDADQAGHRIAVSQRSVQDIYLTRNLKRAELLRVGSVADGVPLLSAGSVHALGGNRMTLLQFAAKIPGSRVLDDNFSVTQHALAVGKGRPAGAAYAKEFIEQAKVSGLVQQAIERSQLRGVNVAPRAPAM
jgi:polar amino acid transport system substrate-binding protein